ncbi:PP2C family serine/threonine-protein phosphatase [Lutibacter sp.]|uniref:PP2C family protein-serine/threonine phosphatase n=1 Tax=Lutibacter sp. TaxID=1925666 RepID=UPI0035687136
MKIQIFGNTIIGKVRDHNEDAFVFSKNLTEQEFVFNPNDNVTFEVTELGSIMCVADGMGGTNAGEVASYEAIQFIKNYFSDKANFEGKETEVVLVEAILKTNDHLINYIKSNPESKGMGTTMVLSLIKNDSLSVAWTGDSRCYILNPSNDDVLYPFTDDHSMVWDLVQAKQMSPEQARVHPNSNIITQSLGDSVNKPNPSFKSTSLKKGDRVILCSDGLNGMISDEKIEDILSQRSNAKELCKILINEANKAGGEDNITVIVSKILEVDNSTANIAAPIKTRGIVKNTSKKLNLYIISIALVILGLILGLILGYFIFKDKSDSTPTIEIPIIEGTQLESKNTADEIPIMDNEKINKKDEETKLIPKVNETGLSPKKDNDSKQTLPVKPIDKNKEISKDTLRKNEKPSAISTQSDKKGITKINMRDTSSVKTPNTISPIAKLDSSKTNKNNQKIDKKL